MKTLKSVLSTAIVAASFFAIAPATLADGDAAAGKRVFNKCKTCHVLEAGQRRMGPHLQCIIGRTAGSVEGYRYSSAMASSGIVWSDESISEYMRNPKTMIPGNKMAFAGLKKDADVDNLLAYLHQEAGGDACGGQ